MYLLKFPPHLNEEYMSLTPGSSKNFIATTHIISDTTTTTVRSVHAIASHDVRVSVKMANILNRNKTATTWMPCPSIPPFTIKAGENYFDQSDYTEVNGYLLFEFTPVETDAEKTPSVEIAMAICFGDRPVYSEPPHKRPVPEPDEFEVTQGASISILKSELMKNDFIELPIMDVLVESPVNGIVTVVGDKVTFTSTGRYGEPASFKYHLVDVEGNKSRMPALVTVNIGMLPYVTGYIFDSSELDDFTNNYKPPTFEDIFKSWARYYNNFHYPSGVPPKGEAASWEMFGAGQFRCTVNSSYLTGFVAPETFTHYEHQADLSSAVTNDDDVVALLIAFKRIGNANYSLLAVREPGGCMPQTNSKNFSICLVVNNTWTVIKAATGNACKSGAAASNIVPAYSWGRQSPTQVKVTREGDLIEVQASPFKSLDMSAGETISIDLNDYPSLAWAKEKLPYGYACWSQQHSTFANVIFTGAGKLDTDTVYTSDTGAVYIYKDGKWVEDSEKIWDVLGYPRIVENPTTKKRYLIEYEKITQIT